MEDGTPSCEYNAKLDRIEHYMEKETDEEGHQWWVCSRCGGKVSAEVRPLGNALVGQIAGGSRT